VLRRCWRHGFYVASHWSDLIVFIPFAWASFAQAQSQGVVLMNVQQWFLKWACKCSVATVMLTMSLAGNAASAHDDLRPRNVSGKVVTDGYDDGTGTTTPNVRVFGYDFGEEASDPFFTQDPGFNSVVGSGLQSGALSFDVLGPAHGSALPYNLSYWDGTGEVTWSAVPNSENLLWYRGASSLDINSSGVGLLSGFSIGNVSASGTIHQHLNAFLEGSDGNGIPAGPGDWGAGDGVEASPGVYALAIVLKNGSLAQSDSIWIVYNNGVDEEAHDVAIDWLNMHAVPEPATWLLAGMGGVSALLVRRHARRLERVTT